MFYDDTFDLGLRRSMRWRTARRWLLMLGLTGFALDTYGLPHLRLSDPTRLRGRPLTYWSVTGMREARPANTPVIVLFPLERPVMDYVSDSAQEILEEVGDGLAR